MNEPNEAVDSPPTLIIEPGRGLINLSRQSLYNHFVERDMDAAFRFMAHDLEWLGPFSCQVASSLQDMKDILASEYDTALAIADEQWKARKYDTVWVISAIYTILCDASGKEAVLPFVQHATYIWANTAEGPRIVHLQVSNATDDNAVAPPLALGQNPLQFIHDNFDVQGMRGAKLEFRDVSGCTHFLHRGEVLCVEAEGPRCRVRHSQGEFAARGSLDQVEEKMGMGFIRTHRSVLVNKCHVSQVRNAMVLLDDGYECPIAKKRLALVRSELGA